MWDHIDMMNDIICDISQDIRAFNKERERIRKMDIEVNHPKHSSTLCLDDILSVESSILTEVSEDEKQESYCDFEQPLVISQPTELSMNKDAKDDKMVLESKEDIKHNSSKDSYPFQVNILLWMLL